MGYWRPSLELLSALQHSFSSFHCIQRRGDDVKEHTSALMRSIVYPHEDTNGAKNLIKYKMLRHREREFSAVEWESRKDEEATQLIFQHPATPRTLSTHRRIPHFCLSRLDVIVDWTRFHRLVLLLHC